MSTVPLEDCPGNLRPGVSRNLPSIPALAISCLAATSSFATSSFERVMCVQDIYTHCLHGFQSTLIDRETGKVHAAAWEAKRRGVLFDIGHGQGSFNW